MNKIMKKMFKSKTMGCRFLPAIWTKVLMNVSIAV